MIVHISKHRQRRRHLAEPARPSLEAVPDRSRPHGWRYLPASQDVKRRGPIAILLPLEITSPACLPPPVDSVTSLAAHALKRANQAGLPSDIGRSTFPYGLQQTVHAEHCVSYPHARFPEKFHDRRNKGRRLFRDCKMNGSPSPSHRVWGMGNPRRALSRSKSGTVTSGYAILSMVSPRSKDDQATERLRLQTPRAGHVSIDAVR